MGDARANVSDRKFATIPRDVTYNESAAHERV